MYRFNGMQMSDVAVLPAQAGHYLCLASELQLRVLLWMATAGRQGGCAADCAAALGGRVTEAACEDAFRYWVGEGLMTSDGAAAPAAGTAVPAAIPAVSPVPAAVLPVVSAPGTEERRTPVKRPPAVKPQMTEVVNRQKQNEKFAFLLVEAGSRLGKALSPADQETLLYLYDTAGLPAEVILLCIAYAVQRGKNNMRYIEKTALDWADRDIRTIGEADAYLCRLTQQDKAFETLSGWCDLPPRPTVTQKALAAKWIGEWGVSRDLLLYAVQVCLEKTGKFQYTYIDRVLESWRAEGWDTAEKVKRGKTAKPEAAAAPRTSAGGFDVSQYEAMVRAHTPKYRKKGQT